MQRRLAALLLTLGLLIILAIPASSHATAQGTIQASARYALPVYHDAARSAHIVGVLAPRADVIIEARSADASWVLGHSADGTVRGWIENRFLDYASSVDVADLIVSTETIFARPTSSYSAYKSVDLYAFPVVPTDLGRAHEILELGRQRGTDSHAISKVGDCISDNRHFLSPFGWGQYNLGNYVQLQGVIDQFEKSMTFDSLAAYDGLVTSAVLDPTFANPLACRTGETPLRCEYRVHNPSVAVIMFGAQDLLFTPPDAFDRNLRQIVHETIQAGIVPIVSTFPGNLDMWNISSQYNQIVVQVARDYDIPLMNLWLALEALPNHGLNPDGRHLSQPITDSGDLRDSNLKQGYPLRNLVTLQALDFVWRNAMY
jgi:hypothetical protein